MCSRCEYRAFWLIKLAPPSLMALSEFFRRDFSRRLYLQSAIKHGHLL
jgi:hypothetical protein